MAGDKRAVIEVLQRLVAVWRAGASWENETIPAYLEAMAAWLERYEQVYVNTGGITGCWPWL